MKGHGDLVLVYINACACVRVCARVRAGVCAQMRVRVPARARVCVRVRARARVISARAHVMRAFRL